MKNFRDLMVWQKAHSLTLASYRGTAEFPKQEIYGLISQIRRCSASIAANIAEGCGKGSNAEFQRFLQIAAGSASELEYHFLLAKDLGRTWGSFLANSTKSSTSPQLRSRECWPASSRRSRRIGGRTEGWMLRGEWRLEEHTSEIPP